MCLLKERILNLFLLFFVFDLHHSRRIYDAKRPEDRQNCDNPYNKCNLGKSQMINVHLVPHTHDDLGWLKTVDEYYNGTLWTVSEILSSSINELANNSKRRFVYVEMGFFWRWWNDQNHKVKEITRKLVKERRLEFIIGGWAMNDEATTYYTDIIDQQTLGLQFILKEFGDCARPRVAWQIDPFGHSREQASLFAQFGFDGLFHGRIDYQDFNYRGQKLTREMIWKASANLGKDAEIFTGILPNGYDPPKGFCFDTICGEPELRQASDENKIEIDEFIKIVEEQAKVYKTNNLIMTMGSDFQFSEAKRWFDNLDILIDHVNERQSSGSKINIFYSTPSCYLYSLYKSNVTWPTKNDDFFPYAHRAHSFWTGYFTSRPTLKEYVRRTSNFYQSVKHLSAFARMTDVKTMNSIQSLADALGIVQHHDGISGTAQQHVTNDYAKRLSTGTQNCLGIIKKSLNKIALTKSNNFHSKITLESHYCPLLNISECLSIENRNKFSVILYNPLARPVYSWIRIPVTDTTYKVTDLKTSNEIESEYVEIYDETKRLDGRKSSANYELLFNAHIPPLGFSTYQLDKTARKIDKLSNNLINLIKDKDSKPFLKNKYLHVTFDAKGNLLKIKNLKAGISTDATQKFCYYKSFPGYNLNEEDQASGAYIFRPNGTEVCLSVQRFTFKCGKTFCEIHQIYNKWISQTVRLYKNGKYIEFEWQVGPINVDDGIGKEVISKFNTDIDSGDVFYTDSNGREIIKRVKDYRPSWSNFNQTEPIAGNYYPVNSQIFIRDKRKRQFTIVNDRSQGGSSMDSGSIELMVHRRNLYDDALGVTEPLNEVVYMSKGLTAKGKHYVFFDTVLNSARLYRNMALQVNNGPLIIFGLPKSNVDYEMVKSLGGWSALKKALPNSVHLLTLMHDFSIDENNSIILRLEHFYERNEDSEYSRPVTVNLVDLLSSVFEITKVEELALGANMQITELNSRLLFNGKKNKKEKVLLTDYTSISLNPMEIRTFRLHYK